MSLLSTVIVEVVSVVVCALSLAQPVKETSVRAKRQERMRFFIRYKRSMRLLLCSGMNAGCFFCGGRSCGGRGTVRGATGERNGQRRQEREK
jgi:hypothetical protein